MGPSVTTLGQFIVERQAELPYATGEFSRLLRDLGTAAKIVNREVNKAGLVDILGEVGVTNIQGEQVKKLDVYANELFVAALSGSGECCMIVSEEIEEPIFVNNAISKGAKYIVAMDPLDGSSNIDVNVAVGTIFSIYPCLCSTPSVKDALQSGTQQLAAGYIIYGSSTMLVYSTGFGVNGFTLDPSIGEFCLSHPQMRVPENGKIYSINEGRYMEFSDGVKQYIKYCQMESKEEFRPYISRYVGSLVADIHRNMIKGGIFIYPSTIHARQGKLRLVYECNPMAFIIEQAGGRASDGFNRILSLDVTEIHQRTPIFIGSKNMVLKAEAFMEMFSPQSYGV